MKFLFVVPAGHFPEMISGQTVGQHELALELTARGHAVTVVSSGWSAPPNQAPIEDHALGYAHWRTRDAVVAAPFIVRADPPDVMVLMSDPDLPRAMVAGHELGLPTIVYLRNVEAHTLQGRLAPDPLFRYLAVSDFTRHRWRNWSGIEAETLSVAIDPARHAVAATGDAITFINPVPAKGVEIALALAAARPQSRFIFVDSWRLPDAYRDRVRARCAALANVEARDTVADMRPIWARTRVLLVPSAWEDAAPRVVREAQCSGIPTLGSDRGGIPELIGAGGVIVPLHAPIGDWADALARMIDDHVHYDRLSRVARAQAARPDRAPDVLIDRFIAIAREHVAAIRG